MILQCGYHTAQTTNVSPRCDAPLCRDKPTCLMTDDKLMPASPPRARRTASYSHSSNYRKEEWGVRHPAFKGPWRRPPPPLPVPAPETTLRSLGKTDASLRVTTPDVQPFVPHPVKLPSARLSVHDATNSYIPPQEFFSQLPQHRTKIPRNLLP